VRNQPRRAHARGLGRGGALEEAWWGAKVWVRRVLLRWICMRESENENRQNNFHLPTAHTATMVKLSFFGIGEGEPTEILSGKRRAGA
jgi:hypothetical protein